MMKQIRRLLKNKSGATAIEYGLIASLVAVAIIVAATSLGSNVAGTFNKVAAQLNK